MKKVGIITLNDFFNYGNRLQNYALQKYLKIYLKILFQKVYGIMATV